MKKLLPIILIFFFFMGLVAFEKDDDPVTDDQVKINEVIELINSLPADITIDSEEEVKHIFTLYEKLTTSEKSKVNNYDTLLAAERVINSLIDGGVSIVIQLIAELPNVDNLALADSDKVEAVRFAYNKLSQDNQASVTNYDILVLIENKLIELNNVEQAKQQALAFDNQVGALPAVSSLTLADKLAIGEARLAYNTLSKDALTYVTKLATLEALEAKLEELVAASSDQTIAKAVNDLIANLPNADNLALSNQAAVEMARTEYDLLTAAQKAYVTNLTKLEALEAKLEELVVASSDQALAKTVSDLINALPAVNNITLNNKVAAETARTKYNALTAAQKAYVTNLTKLEEVEARITELLVVVTDQALAKVVSDAIDDLPATNLITFNDKAAIDSARAKYNALTEAQKAYVTNLTKLENLETIMTAIQVAMANQQVAKGVSDLINNLPSVDTLSLSNKAAVEDARVKYNALTSDQKSFVINLTKLEALEAKIIELTSSNTYKVIFRLNGGELAGTTPVNNQTLLFSSNINYYSTGYWDAYQTQVVVFKTSLIGAADLYTSAYKIGFTYDMVTSQYVVDQIISDDTPLSSSNKTSTYFIFVNSNNSNSYNTFKTISAGDVITIDKTLPDTSTTSLDLNMGVYRKDTSSPLTYQATYSGEKALDTPTRTGYQFVGWYGNSTYTGEAITKVSQATTLYAKWVNDSSGTSDDILNCVSDIAASNTVDSLILQNDNATFVWHSSNNNLYNITNGIGTVSKIYQTHKTQTVTVSVDITYMNGTKETKSKLITINPVLYENFPSTPVATYFSTSALYAYKQYNERYLTNGTLFSNSTKETLDIIYYSFITFDASGNVQFSDDSYMNEVRALKANDVRIIGCLNGVSFEASSNLDAITSNATLRATFVNNLMNLVERYNLDGLDIDWESVTGAYVKAAGLNALIGDLRRAMTLRQASGGTPYFLSIAVPASSWGTASDRFDFRTLDTYLDYINIMSYDMNVSNKTTHLSPLYKSSYDNGYGFGCDYGINRLTSLGFSRNKLIIGSAGYGKAYKVTGSATSSKYPGLGAAATLTQISGVPGSFASGTLFGNGIQALINSGSYTKYDEYNSDNKYVGSYLYNSSSGVFVTYDSKESIIAKYNYADSLAGVGIMCWCYSEDTTDTVINAIATAIAQK